MIIKVSIIIPVYNVAPYVEECIRSVMNQTQTEGVECIIVDDCGQDNSMEIVENVIACEGYKPCGESTFSSNLSPLTYQILHHDYNRGLSAARNTGIDAAIGEYVYFLDGDDRINPDCIERLVSSIKKYPESQIVFAGAEATGGNYKWLDYTTKQLPEYSNDHDWLQLSMLRRYDFGMTAWNRLILRSFILENNLLFEEGLVHEDEVWNFEISKHIQAASFVKQNTYTYNIHNNSIVTSATENVRWDRLFDLWNVLVSRIEGEKKQLQIRAISKFILVETKRKIFFKHRASLCCLYFRLGIKSCSCLSILFFLQGLLALCYPSKYSNHYTCSRIGL